MDTGMTVRGRGEWDGTLYPWTETNEKCILNALKRVETEGWSKTGNRPGVTAVSALAHCSHGFEQRCHTRDYFRLAIGQYEVGAWESGSKATKELVLEKLAEAATIARDDGMPDLPVPSTPVQPTEGD